MVPYIAKVNGIEGIDIDYPEDFEIADAVYMKLCKEHTFVRGAIACCKQISEGSFSVFSFLFKKERRTAA